MGRAVEFCCLLGPLTILLSALAAWLYHRRISARRNTFDFIASNEVNNAEWGNQRSSFFKLAQSGELLNLVNPQNPRDNDQREKSIQVSLFLSHFEFVAVTIKNKAMDEKIYKEWYKTVYVNTWKRSEAYIVARRNQTDQHSIYVEFEQLAKKWQDRPS